MSVPPPATSSPDIDALREAARTALEGATPGEWERDSEKGENAYGSGPDHGENYEYALIGAPGPGGKWMTLFDSNNSDAASVEEDYDEDYHRAWDAVAERNAAAIVAAVNYLRAGGLDEARTLAAEVARMREALAVARDALDGAAQWFDGYQEAHADKGATEKAQRNQERRDACHVAANTARAALAVQP